MAIEKYHREDNREVILKHIISDEGSVPLSDKQVELLERWRAADELIRKQQFRREEIARQLMEQFNVSRDTAFAYMTNAEWVFSSSAPLNKMYEIGCRIEFLKEMIRNASATTMEVKEWVKNDKDEMVEQVKVVPVEVDYKSIAMLEKTLQGYYELYPQQHQKRRPTNTVFNVLGNINIAVMKSGDAIEKAIIINEQLKTDE